MCFELVSCYPESNLWTDSRPYALLQMPSKISSIIGTQEMIHDTNKILRTAKCSMFSRKSFSLDFATTCWIYGTTVLNHCCAELWLKNSITVWTSGKFTQYTSSPFTQQMVTGQWVCCLWTNMHYISWCNFSWFYSRCACIMAVLCDRLTSLVEMDSTVRTYGKPNIP